MISKLAFFLSRCEKHLEGAYLFRVERQALDIVSSLPAFTARPQEASKLDKSGV